MPDIIVHTKFGAEIYDRLNLKINRDIYNFGLVGPDPFLFYRFYVPPFRNRINKYSSVMHREHTGEFLMELANRAKDNEEVLSYLCGFLCHYALDSNAHPYINAKADNDIFMHLAIEHKLDRENGDTIRIPPFLPESMKYEFADALKTVYGWDDAWEKFRQGRLDMKPFYRLISDKNGSFDRVAKLTHTKLKLLSYKSREIDDMDLSGFYPLYDNALIDAEKYIKAALSYVKNEIPEEELKTIIGNRSYIDG